ncbi:MAG: flagellar filament capping protein FliD, partial [Pseudomonadota bacterium]|nr:flagellar filament capping protein FliD [Pseudomonadota bacterium]
STGIGSGLDVNTIVTQLMAAERAPLNILQTKQSGFNAKLSAFGTLKSAISTFQTTVTALNATGLGANSTTVGDATTVGASATSAAIPGSYAIEVSQLARQYKLSSAGHADATAQLGTGSMSIQVGANAAVTIPAADYTLKGLSDAINAAKAGVSATIVNDGSANHLVITATDTGLANSIKVTAGAGLAEFAYDPTSPPAGPPPVMVQNQAGQDAKLKIDNIDIVKSSNTITDAITGLTLNLLKNNVGSPTTVTVAADKAAAKTAVTAFVDAYNKLSGTIKTMTAYNATTKTGAVLNGEGGATAVVTALRRALNTAVPGGGLTALSDIGITFQRDGTLAADATKLQTSLDTNFSGVTALFAGTDGYATRLTAATTDMLGAQGLITSRTDGLNTAIKKNAVSQDDMNTRLNQTEKRYRAQFSALDSVISKMQTTSTFLTQQLTALENNK